MLCIAHAGDHQRHLTCWGGDLKASVLGSYCAARLPLAVNNGDRGIRNRLVRRRLLYLAREANTMGRLCFEGGEREKATSYEQQE